LGHAAPALAADAASRRTGWLLWRWSMSAVRKRVIIGGSLVFLTLGLTQAPAQQSASGVVAKYDTDNDKTLDLNEVKAAATAHFDKLNKDNDQTLEANEVKHVLGPKAFQAADTDHDGSISRDEYLALVQKLFTEADADHDGKLSSAELKSKSGRALKRLIN
jgi:Ca2+-binding EF-hand superfamily protein